MPYILNIDTATEHASVCLSKGNKLVAIRNCYEQKSHSSFLHPAIADILQEASISLTMLDAVAVSAGPGSYTGLRVGMASAKGLCYALQKPLLAIPTLAIMAFAALQTVREAQGGDVAAYLFCSAIDARRMEVFMALYNHNLEVVMPPAAIILDENCVFEKYLSQKIMCIGSGSNKILNAVPNSSVVICETHTNASHLIPFSLQFFTKQHFENIAYCEPNYIKSFYSPSFAHP